MELLRGVALLARCAGLLGHIAEEIRRPVADSIYRTVDRNAVYIPPVPDRMRTVTRMRRISGDRRGSPALAPLRRPFLRTVIPCEQPSFAGTGMSPEVEQWQPPALGAR